MLVKRRGPDGVERQLSIPDLTEHQLRAWERGGLIQNVLPHLTADQREFLLTGMTPEEFDDLFEESQDDDI